MKKFKIIFVIFCFIAVCVLLGIYLHNNNVQVLNPKGWIAERQKSLVIISSLLMLIVVIPVFGMTFYFTVKYHAGRKSKYSPEWDNNNLAEAIWWGMPLVIVIGLSVLCWTSSHELDPFKPLESDKKPLTIQVVALQWKWLFIYPEQKIATVNYIQFPEKTPLNFEITSDAPMNSFWIPQLGGQIYAMAGMRTQLHLIANEQGSFRGCSANLSGAGFSGMTFTAEASSDEAFEKWVDSVKPSPSLTAELYESELLKPTSYHPVTTYVLQEENLYDNIVMKYMHRQE